MSRKWPVISTIIVALACATMIALGIWQVGRAQERDRQAATFALNSRNAAPVAFPRLPPVADDQLYRASSVNCLEVIGWEPSGGTAADGTRGFRFIASCRTGAEGPGVLVDMGVSADPEARPTWAGGPVSGRITLAPQESGMLAQLFRTLPPAQPLLVADAPAPGLLVSAAPDPTTRGNSSWAYALQWFLFALAAGVIYVLAVRRYHPTARRTAKRNGGNDAYASGGDSGSSGSRWSDGASDGTGDGGGDGGGGD